MLASVLALHWLYTDGGSHGGSGTGSADAGKDDDDDERQSAMNPLVGGA